MFTPAKEKFTGTFAKQLKDVIPQILKLLKLIHFKLQRLRGSSSSDKSSSSSSSQSRKASTYTSKTRRGRKQKASSPSNSRRSNPPKSSKPLSSKNSSASSKKPTPSPTLSSSLSSSPVSSSSLEGNSSGTSAGGGIGVFSTSIPKELKEMGGIGVIDEQKKKEQGLTKLLAGVLSVCARLSTVGSLVIWMVDSGMSTAILDLFPSCTRDQQSFSIHFCVQTLCKLVQERSCARQIKLYFDDHGGLYEGFYLPLQPFLQRPIPLSPLPVSSFSIPDAVLTNSDSDSSSSDSSSTEGGRGPTDTTQVRKQTGYDLGGGAFQSAGSLPRADLLYKHSLTFLIRLHEHHTLERSERYASAYHIKASPLPSREELVQKTHAHVCKARTLINGFLSGKGDTTSGGKSQSQSRGWTTATTGVSVTGGSGGNHINHNSISSNSGYNSTQGYHQKNQSFTSSSFPKMSYSLEAISSMSLSSPPAGGNNSHSYVPSSPGTPRSRGMSAHLPPLSAGAIPPSSPHHPSSPKSTHRHSPKYPSSPGSGSSHRVSHFTFNVDSSNGSGSGGRAAKGTTGSPNNQYHARHVSGSSDSPKLSAGSASPNLGGITVNPVRRSRQHQSPKHSPVNNYNPVSSAAQAISEGSGDANNSTGYLNNVSLPTPQGLYQKAQQMGLFRHHGTSLAAASAGSGSQNRYNRAGHIGKDCCCKPLSLSLSLALSLS